MGCDTHMYIEYAKKGDDHWKSYGGRLNPGRNYFNIRGEQLRRPLKENFTGKARERVEAMIKNWDSLGNELAK